ncbi:MAG: protein kinase [Pirellulaceae bacterium]|nr:protein kinase [Pirellulaceae bacterium]
MSANLTAEAATQAWDDLAERLERFLATWEAGTEPTLAEYLPAEPPAHRQRVLVELIKADLEQRSVRGRPKSLDEYLAQHPELLADGEPPCDLIYEEFHLRRAAGQPVSIQDYCRRYPRSAEALRRLAGTSGATISTQLVSPTRRLDGFVAGKRLDDFDLLVELGKGAFGSVFLARQISMQRLVALKVSADRGNEPQTLAQLDHPNIVRVFDQRRLPSERVRLLYMQFAPGGTLAEVAHQVRATPPAARSGAILIACVAAGQLKAGFPGDEDAPWRRRVAASTWPETVCRLGLQLAQALDYAHKQGILHRDVKPANILLSGEGSPKLADFNISFASQLEGATPAAYFGGSMAYMSPEQLEACNPEHSRLPDDLDGRSDLYALGVVLWELLYGQRPYADVEEVSWTATLAAMASRRRAHQPTSPGPPPDAVAARLDAVLRKVLSPDVSRRHADGAALARDLSLCTNPRAWSLVHDLGSGWRSFAAHQPLIALVPVNLPPFILAGIFNYLYNHAYILKLAEQEPAIMTVFNGISLFVNSALYPLGVVVVLAFAWPVARVLRRLARETRLPEDELRAARRRSLQIGHVVALVGLVLWLVAGLTFPTGLSLFTETFPPQQGFVHFFLAMATCGLISCVFPFLATTWLAVRVFFPALLASATPDPREQRQLAALGRQAGYYLPIAVVVPLLAVALLILSDPGNRAASIGLIAAGGVGFLGAYAMFNRIRGDLAALTIATRPVEMLGTSTDTVESF